MNRKQRRAAHPPSATPGFDPGREMQQAVHYHQAGELPRAGVIYERILKHYPDHPDALHLLGLVVESEGQSKRAIALIRRALEIQPDFIRAHNNLGNILKEQGDMEGALRHYQRTIELDPRHAKAHYNLGKVFEDLVRLDEAATCYRRAVECDPDFVAAHNNLGNILHDQGDYEAAQRCFLHALELDPNNGDVHRNLGAIFQSRGDFDEAAAKFERAIELNPEFALPYASLAMIKKFRRDDPLIARIEHLLQSGKVARKEQSELHFALGKIFNDAEDYDNAFEHYRMANELEKESKPHNPEAISDNAARIMEVFTRGFFSTRSGWGMQSERPLFIVGMPRSGTTLVEQIISSHPDVFGAGELRQIAQLETNLSQLLATGTPYPECAEEITREKASLLGQDYLDYLDKLPRLPHGTKRITDKAPPNFHRLGLIALLLPNARVIHCSRNAMDTCLSCYFQNFLTQNFSHDLRHIGNYYRSYDRLMKHWRTALPLPILEVNYETLVADKEKISRDIVEFCGLEWDEACLAHDKAERPVITASQWQIRQPVYTTSVERWRRYEKHLGPLIDELNAAK